jgi:phage gp16-like protein
MSQMRFIYGACRQLGIEDEDTRRDLFERVTGKRSLRAMNNPEQKRLVVELKRMGGGARAKTKSEMSVTGPYAGKLQALWIAAWNLGLVRDRSDKALTSFVKRQCGIAHMRWLREEVAAAKVIEALKSWMAREAGVVWSRSDCPRFLKSPAAKVAWAQWRLLHPDAEMDNLSQLEVRVARLVKRPVSLASLTTKEWQTVSNALGVQVRRQTKV